MNIQSCKREVTILTDKELDYAKQSHFKSKEILLLRDRVEVLESQHVMRYIYMCMYIYICIYI
jgi:hypothetical protein